MLQYERVRRRQRWRWRLTASTMTTTTTMTASGNGYGGSSKQMESDSVRSVHFQFKIAFSENGIAAIDVRTPCSCAIIISCEFDYKWTILSCGNRLYSNSVRGANDESDAAIRVTKLPKFPIRHGENRRFFFPVFPSQSAFQNGRA